MGKDHGSISQSWFGDIVIIALCQSTLKNSKRMAAREREMPTCLVIL